MRALCKDIIWIGLFAVAMSGLVGTPVATIFGVAFLLDNRDGELIPFLVIFATFFFFLSAGLLSLLRRHRRRERDHGTLSEGSDEAELMQELHQRSLEMDRRLESLETILLSRAGHREHTNR